MKKSTINLWLNILAFFDFIALAATGSIMRWVLPPGSGGRRGSGGGEGLGKGWRGGRGGIEFADLGGTEPERAKALLGLGRHDWGDWHFWLAVALLVIILLHIVLHWSWVRANIFRWKRRGASPSV